MARFDYRDTLTAFGFPNGLSAFHVANPLSGPVVYAATLSGGGVTAFAPDGAGGLMPLGWLAYPDDLAAGIVPSMTNGKDSVLVSGLTGWALAPDAAGVPLSWTPIPGFGASTGPLHVTELPGATYVLASDDRGDLAAFALTAQGASLASSLPGLSASAIAASDDGALYAVSAETNRITQLALSGVGGLSAGQVAGALDGLGWDAPSALRIADVAGETFLVVAAAGSSSLTVLGFDGGVFGIAEHVVDDRTTRFAGVSGIDTVTVNGRTLLAAGGGDDGVTVFEILPGGRLVHLQTEVDTPSRALGNVSAVSLFTASGWIQLAAAGQSDGGLSLFARAEASLAAPLIAGHSGASLAGGAVDDLLYGGAGGDALSGGAGDDILFDGGGVDVLRGGPGADVFVFASDGLPDRIEDFEPGVDRLDLSGFPGLYSLSGLSIYPTADGARLTFADEVIDVRSASGAPLDPGQFALSDVLGVTRPPLATLGRDVSGTASADTLFGAVGDDRLSGLAGDDRLVGLDGGDSLLGGPGYDILDGGAGRDVLAGGSDADSGDGGPGADVLLGGSGGDRLAGGDGADLLSGGSGGDALDGGAGDDILRGGSGDDRLSGGTGSDRLLGGDGADVLDGGDGADLLDGGDGNDVLTGGDGSDVFVFRAGGDKITDFVPGADRISLALHPEVPDWAALESRLGVGAGGARIDLGGGDILTLTGLDPAALSEADFLF